MLTTLLFLTFLPGNSLSKASQGYSPKHSQLVNQHPSWAVDMSIYLTADTYTGGKTSQIPLRCLKCFPNHITAHWAPLQQPTQLFFLLIYSPHITGFQKFLPSYQYRTSLFREISLVSLRYLYKSLPTKTNKTKLPTHILFKILVNKAWYTIVMSVLLHL